MSIELSSEVKDEAIRSLQIYADENFDEPMGNIAASALLEFIIEEIGPSIYNQAVADVRDRMQARLMDIDVEVTQEEFTYWLKRDRKRS